MNNNEKYQDIPKLSDIMVGLKGDDKTCVVVKKGRAIGPTIPGSATPDIALRSTERIVRNQKERNG